MASIWNPSPKGLETVTWNADAGSPSPGPRISTLLQTIESHITADIIFLQEVNEAALVQLLAHPWVQQNWYSNEADTSHFRHQALTTVTLISKSSSVKLGQVWRVNLPSPFERDGLCCDVFAKNASQKENSRVRLVNVHLDSLHTIPLLRMQQVWIVTQFMRSAGCGVVAGDFDPLFQEDEKVLQINGLVDSWASFRQWDPGYTWGLSEEEQLLFSSRLGKVVVYSLAAANIDMLPVSSIQHGDTALDFSQHHGICCFIAWQRYLTPLGQQD
ncbi:hypothetical protein BU23DRAFT_592704 [Bimuria novae-zelandiae CBS 107.79]|uniref:Endonuclease/exonuclease/phosphatase domain-containing protein n=1 Tax=Bimuria novae-zelandiae CBS 107.79 TaxID=1447943 RepID=A0A6A5UQ04_9PLEO|nr:hypothetical protein BU23DRAFT_592704 [Bimuria novae-zelandiae CBS 107.79]